MLDQTTALLLEMAVELTTLTPWSLEIQQIDAYALDSTSGRIH